VYFNPEKKATLMNKRLVRNLGGPILGAVAGLLVSKWYACHGGG